MSPQVALPLALALAVLTTGCVHSTGGRVENLNIRSVSVSPKVNVSRDLDRTDATQTLKKGGLRIDDIVRREFYVALQRGTYFPQIVGAVPVTPVDSDWDVEVSRRRSVPQTLASAQGYFQLIVNEWGYRGAFGNVEATIKLEANLYDRAGNLLAWGSANSADSTVPTRYPREFLGDTKMAASDISIAARIASERLLETMLRTGGVYSRAHAPRKTKTTTTTTTTVTTTRGSAPSSSASR